MSELEFLVGKELRHISCRYWQFDFGFDVGNIAVEGDLEHLDAQGDLHRHNTDADRLAPLYVHHLLGQSVEKITAEPFCLTLWFNQGDHFRIFSDEGQFECGQITDDKGNLILSKSPCPVRPPWREYRLVALHAEASFAHQAIIGCVQKRGQYEAPDEEPFCKMVS